MCLIRSTTRHSIAPAGTEDAAEGVCRQAQYPSQRSLPTACSTSSSMRPLARPARLVSRPRLRRRAEGPHRALERFRKGVSDRDRGRWQPRSSYLSLSTHRSFECAPAEIDRSAEAKHPKQRHPSEERRSPVHQEKSGVDEDRRKCNPMDQSARNGFEVAVSKLYLNVPALARSKISMASRGKDRASRS